MRKKLLIGLLVCGIVGDGGVCAHELWVTPYSLTAEFTGKKPYIYDTLNKKDIIVKEKNIFGHEDAVSDFTINADTLKLEKQKVTVTSGKLKTNLMIESIPLKEIDWDYDAEVVYQGEAFDSQKLKGTAVFGDGNTTDISSAEVLSNIDDFTAGENDILMNTSYGKSTAEIKAIGVKSIETSNKDIYEGTYSSKDFSYRLIYEDRTSKEVAADEISLPDTIELVPGENKIEAEYDGQKYTVTISALKKTAVIKASETYKDEVDSADYKHISDSVFLTIRKLEQDNGSYLLTHIVVNDVNQIKGGLSNDTFGGTRELPSSVASRTASPLVINGSYFSYDTGKPACAGIFIKNGEIMQEGTTNGNEICIDKNGKLFTPKAGISAQSLLEQGVRDSWGTADPVLLQDSQPVSTIDSLHSKYYPRTTIGMKKPGEYYIMTALTNGYSGGLSFSFMQKKFQELGCTYARSLDGGGSSSLIFEGKLINNPAAGSERPVVDTLYISE